MTRTAKTTTLVLVSVLILCLLMAGVTFANGGPFVLKYPNGDPAAKGVLARLDPDLKPGREMRLRVTREDLKVKFAKERFFRSNTAGPPLAHVSAEYTIENPTEEDIEVDFGFPILRGIYVSPYSMLPRPEVVVLLGREPVECTIISNSAIYGIIRQRSREVIEKAITDNQQLNNLIKAVRSEDAQGPEAARRELYAYLVDNMKWNQRDAALLVEYAALDFGSMKSHPPDRLRWGWTADTELNELISANLGPLSAIGEQKATQFFAQLASCFEPETTAAYEAIFTAWGGDVRERSIDLITGDIRPREITVDSDMLNKPAHLVTDPTIYARVDYLDPKANITESEKASCKEILKNLPVIFTFAPMNILHYQVSFPAKSTRTLTVSYSQYAYSDTRSPSSYQLAYVVHPASLWNEFGPINLEVAVPEGVGFRASVACNNGGVEERQLGQHNDMKWRCDIYRAKLKEKTGELYLAVDMEEWKKAEKRMIANSIKSEPLPVIQK